MYVNILTYQVLSSLLLATTFTQGAPLEARYATCPQRPHALKVGASPGDAIQIGSFVWNFNNFDCTNDEISDVPYAVGIAAADAALHPCGVHLPTEYNKVDPPSSPGRKSRLEILGDSNFPIPYQDLQEFMDYVTNQLSQADTVHCQKGDIRSTGDGQPLAGRWSLGPPQ